MLATRSATRTRPVSVSPALVSAFLLAVLLVGNAATAPSPARAETLFASPFRSFDAGGIAYALAVGDLNGDGTRDVVTTGVDVNLVSVLLGSGDGTLGTATNFGTGISPRSVAIGDLNGDGKPDLVVANYGTYETPGTTVSVLLGNGNGTFGTKHDFGTGSSPHSVAIGDFNGDGKPDMAVANSFDDTVSVLLGNGDGTFGPKTDYVTGSDPLSVAIPDLNGDGKLDLVTANSTANTVSVLLGNGDGSFGARTDYETGSGPQSVAIADLDADGAPDLAVADFGSWELLGNSVSVLLGNGDGTFAARADYGTESGPISLAIGHFNGDTAPDLAVVSIARNTVSVLLGIGDGTFGPQSAYGAGGGARPVAIGDLDGDGKTDLAVGSNMTVSVLLGNGNGSFGSGGAYETGLGPQSVAIGDLDGDGEADLAAANCGISYPAGNTVSVLLGNGDGSFGADCQYETGLAPMSVAIGDFNGDGNRDLVVANYGTSYSPGNRVSVLLGNGDGTFGWANDYWTGNRPRCVAIGDFNGDARPDLAVVNHYGSSVSVLLGNGDGTFAPRQDFATGLYPTSVAIGDLNVDGKLDLATANSQAYTVSVLLGNGNGTFGVKHDYGTGAWPKSVAIGDMNGDGKPDLVTANDDGPSVSVLLGYGNGTFAVKQDYATACCPKLVATGDLDGDGKRDVVVTGDGTNTVSVLLGNGDGSLGWKTDYGTGNRPQALAVGDVNGDGRLDLAVANFGYAEAPGHTVSVLLNIGSGPSGVLPAEPTGNGWRAEVLPNPTSRGVVTFRLAMPRAGRVSLEIFDVTGRLVRTLRQGSMDGSEVTVVWSGRDDAGNALPSGIYFVKVEAGGETSTARVVLAR